MCATRVNEYQRCTRFLRKIRVECNVHSTFTRYILRSRYSLILTDQILKRETGFAHAKIVNRVEPAVKKFYFYSNKTVTYILQSAYCRRTMTRTPFRITLIDSFVPLLCIVRKHCRPWATRRRSVLRNCHTSCYSIHLISVTAVPFFVSARDPWHSVVISADEKQSRVLQPEGRRLSVRNESLSLCFES